MIGLFPASLDAERQTRTLIGSQIGAQEFTRALMRWLPSESLRLFVEESAIPQAQADITAFERNYPGSTTNARIVSMEDLPAQVNSARLLAFHDMTGPFLHRQTYVRSRFAAEQFPVTTLIHGLSYNFGLWDFVSRMVLAPTLPCDSVICTSRAARDAMANLLGRAAEGLGAAVGHPVQSSLRLDLIPLGVDTDLYHPRDPQECRRLLGLPLDKTVLLYFGRIDAATKGDLHPLLLTFAALARKHGSKLLLLLAGSTNADYVERLNKVAAQMGCDAPVVIRNQPGFVEGPLYYGAADIFVSPVETLQESFGITPLEAMASGLPVVGSDWSGYRDTIVHGQTGFLARTRWTDCSADVALLSPLHSWSHDHMQLGQSVAVDTADLYSHLDTLIANPELRRQMGECARQHALAKFHWRLVAEQTHTLWKELREIADTIPYERSPAPSLIQSDYFHDFGHYATEIIGPTAVLRLTDAGSESAKKFPQHLLHPGMQTVLNPTFLQVILRFIRAGSLFRQSVTFKEVADRVSDKYKISQQAARRHVMWLLKYGFLQIQ